MSFIGKSYKAESSENFDEYMKALGVNIVLRKLGNTTKATTSLTEKDGVYTFTVTSAVKNQVIVFKLGQEVDEETLDGRKCKSTFSLDGNVLTQIQKGDKTSTIVRTFTDTELRTELKVDNVVCTRISKAM